MTAAEVAQFTGGRLVAAPDARVDGPTVVDSRRVVPGALFVALAGESTDGHDHAPAAVAAGAALVLAEREVDGLPSVVVDDVPAALGLLAAEHLRRLRAVGGLQVVAVTGSVGKTTTKDLLGQVLSGSGATTIPEASFNNEIGLPLTVLQTDAGTRFLVLEMGASAVGDLTYLTGIAPPDVSIVLAVGSAHLGGFGGIEAVALAKSEIISGLVPGGVAVLNADDQRVAGMGVVASGPVVTFGTGLDVTVRARDVSTDKRGRVTAVVQRGAEVAPLSLQLVGEHHLTNALAAVTAATELGVGFADAIARVSAARALSPHRMAVTDRADGVTIIDDSYNANPDSMRAALQALAVMAGRDRRSIAVLGEMRELGPGASEAHVEIGRLVVRLDITLLIVVGAGASGFAEGATPEGVSRHTVIEVADVPAAARFLAAELRADDVVLVKASNDSGLWRLGNELTTVVAS